MAGSNVVGKPRTCTGQGGQSSSSARSSVARRGRGITRISHCKGQVKGVTLNHMN